MLIYVYLHIKPRFVHIFLGNGCSLDLCLVLCEWLYFRLMSTRWEYTESSFCSYLWYNCSTFIFMGCLILARLNYFHNGSIGHCRFYGTVQYHPIQQRVVHCSGADQRKHQSPALLAFVGGINRWPVDSPHKGPVIRKMFQFDDVIMCFKYRPCTDSTSLKTACCHDANFDHGYHDTNFIGPDRGAGRQNDNSRCRYWWQSLHHDSRFSRRWV